MMPTPPGIKIHLGTFVPHLGCRIPSANQRLAVT
jgi:hypothetical protein